MSAIARRARPRGQCGSSPATGAETPVFARAALPAGAAPAARRSTTAADRQLTCRARGGRSTSRQARPDRGPVRARSRRSPHVRASGRGADPLLLPAAADRQRSSRDHVADPESPLPALREPARFKNAFRPRYGCAEVCAHRRGGTAAAVEARVHAETLLSAALRRTGMLALLAHVRSGRRAGHDHSYARMCSRRGDRWSRVNKREAARLMVRHAQPEPCAALLAERSAVRPHSRPDLIASRSAGHRLPRRQANPGLRCRAIAA